MKIEIDKDKISKATSSLMQGTVDLGKKAATIAKSSVTTMVENSKADSLARRIKKFNPLFPEQFNSENFNIPNLIIIVDDAVRRGIDVCEGAIGWLSNNTGVEVLHLYDEYVPQCGLQFIPSVSCDAVYYVDSFDRKRFIRTDCIFSKAHEERLAELKHIAYSLGAKRCSIQISEAISDTQVHNKNQKFAGSYKSLLSNTESSEQSFVQKNSSQRSGRIEAEFDGHTSPQRPILKWFAHDDNINRLIEMCCDGNRSVKSEFLELSGSSSATMSQKTACSIDAAIGKVGGAKGHTSMNSEAAKEHHSKLLFQVEF